MSDLCEDDLQKLLENAEKRCDLREEAYKAQIKKICKDYKDEALIELTNFFDDIEHTLLNQLSDHMKQLREIERSNCRLCKALEDEAAYKKEIDSYISKEIPLKLGDKRPNQLLLDADGPM